MINRKVIGYIITGILIVTSIILWKEVWYAHNDTHRRKTSETKYKVGLFVNLGLNAVKEVKRASP